MLVNEQIEVNQKDCLEIAKSELTASQSRMRDLDSKLNVLLVFLSALIAGIGTLISEFRNYENAVIFSCVVSCAIFMIMAVFLVLVGIFPRSYYSIDSKTLNDCQKHSLGRNDFIMFYLDAYTYCLSVIKKICAIKSIMVRIATGLLAAAVVMFMIIILILL